MIGRDFKGQLSKKRTDWKGSELFMETQQHHHADDRHNSHYVDKLKNQTSEKNKTLMVSIFNIARMERKKSSTQNEKVISVVYNV